MKNNEIQLVPLFDDLKHLDPVVAIPLIQPIAEAAIDYRYACEFLYSYRGSEATYNAYRRELERLLHWCWQVKKRSIKTLNRADIEDFISFCQNPPVSWIGVKHVARYVDLQGQRIPHAEWRPFVVRVSKIAFQRGETPDPKRYALSTKAVQALFAIIGSFYNFLVQVGYCPANPVAQIRQKSKYFPATSSQQVIRRLSELQWDYVMETAELMATQQPEIHERTLFIMSALYGMYLRISELASSPRWQPTMGDFYQDSDGFWWFTTLGKGNKQRTISVSDAMLSALKRYRLSCGLPSFPLPGESTPLITHVDNPQALSSTRHIRHIVQTCFDAAVARLKQDGFEQEAENLRAATVHWLRHTGISDDVKVRPREHVRDDAGHSSSAITDKYIDVERRERHASKRRQPIRLFEEETD